MRIKVFIFVFAVFLISFPLSCFAAGNNAAPENHESEEIEAKFKLASAFFGDGKYSEALKSLFSVYLKLDAKTKLAASKTVFFAYLYLEKFDSAAKWYNELDDTKKANLQPELNKWLNADEENRRKLNIALNKIGAAEIKPDSEASMTIDEIIRRAERGESASQVDKEQKDAEIVEENLDNSDEQPSVFEFDRSYVPDWKKVCVVLSANDRWAKYNDVIKGYINWHFTKFDKNGIKPEFIEYDSEKSIDEAMKKAKKIKCFAVVGPFFAPEFAESFIAKSTEYSVPVISYVPFSATTDSLFFNIMPSKDSEAENLVKYAVSERERKKFAIAYLDDANGRYLRDIYWRAIEAGGGEVVDLINVSAADNAYMDDVAEVVGKQDNYDEAIRTFKWRNKEKFPNETMLRRAVERFTKMIPGKCAFDTLVVLTPPVQTAMLLPAFPYLNVEFAYYQKYMNRAVSVKKQELRKEGFDWDIQQILVLAPSEIINIPKTIEQLGKLVDGMVVFAPTTDVSEKNEKYAKIISAFKAGNNRPIYFAETIAAEVADTVLSAHAASQKSDIGSFVDTLKSASFTSLLSGKTVKFDELNRMNGSSEILIGRNKEPFMTPAAIEEELKRKAEEKLKEGKPQQDEQENEAAEN